MIDQGIVSVLAANAGVAAILATGGAGSIFQTEVPEDAAQYPCVGYRFVGGASKPTLTTSGMQRARLEVSCWGVEPRGREEPGRHRDRGAQRIPGAALRWHVSLECRATAPGSTALAVARGTSNE